MLPYIRKLLQLCESWENTLKKLEIGLGHNPETLKKRLLKKPYDGPINKIIRLHLTEEMQEIEELIGVFKTFFEDNRDVAIHNTRSIDESFGKLFEKIQLQFSAYTSHEPQEYLPSNNYSSHEYDTEHEDEDECDKQHSTNDALRLVFNAELTKELQNLSTTKNQQLKIAKSIRQYLIDSSKNLSGEEGRSSAFCKCRYTFPFHVTDALDDINKTINEVLMQMEHDLCTDDVGSVHDEVLPTLEYCRDFMQDMADRMGVAIMNDCYSTPPHGTIKHQLN